MDVHSKEQRSYNMSQIKSKDTKPEILVRKWLWENDYRYRLHRKDIPGKPDITFIGKKKVIFINGCFWHKHNCKYFKWPKTNTEFWKKKIEDTVKRDEDNYSRLKDMKWKYLVLWECEIKHSFYEKVEVKISKFLENNRR